MLNKFKNRKQEGFTIIEVLIVLAIAGLILLIVFLAVPALQRNARNTGIRTDAGNLLSGVNEYVANNSGVLPTTVACAADGTVTISGAGQSNTTKVKAGTVCQANPSFPATTATGTIYIALGQKCTNNTTLAASARSFSATFRVESGSGTNPSQCVES